MFLKVFRPYIKLTQGTYVAQLVEHPTLDFDLGHDHRVVELSLELGSALRGVKNGEIEKNKVKTNKNNSKWIIRLCVKYRTIKLLRENL